MCKESILRHSFRTMNLHSPIYHIASHCWRCNFDHCNNSSGFLGTKSINHVSSLQSEQSALVNFYSAVCNISLNRSMSCKMFAESYSVNRAETHFMKSSFSETNQSHAMVNSSRSKTSLCDFKSPSFTQENILFWYNDVCECYFHVSMRCIIKSKNIAWPYNRNSFSVHWDQNHTLLPVSLSIRVGFAHEYTDSASRVTSSTNIPFSTIDNVVISFTANICFNITGIGGCNIRFSHTKAGSNVSSKQRFEIFILLFLGSIAVQNFHISSIWSRTIENFRGDMRSAHNLCHRCILKVGKSRTKLSFLWEPKIPQTCCLCLFLHFFHYFRIILPSIFALSYL
mmetsp:Transcript_8075/g.10014  ORF Transcript_8075/g.10014 Transcript_8075/m.10014 type:complete len:340 (+) Transcript_8075:176-1195(+)